MHQDTDIGGRAGRFPPTRHSAVQAAQSRDDTERAWALEALVAGYWKPAYKYLRLRWRLDNETAKDFTQGFFTHLLDKDLVATYDPEKAAFRTWLRMCLDGFAANQDKAQKRIKRGGGQTIQSLDFRAADGELQNLEPPADDNCEAWFHREWVRSIFAHAVDALQQQCRERDRDHLFELFEQYDLQRSAGDQPPSYQEIGERLGFTVTQVTNKLADVRRRFRRLVLDHLRQITGSDDEYHDQARELLGVEPK